jgi:hypothetical protein
MNALAKRCLGSARALPSSLQHFPAPPVKFHSHYFVGPSDQQMGLHFRLPGSTFLCIHSRMKILFVYFKIVLYLKHGKSFDIHDGYLHVQ